MKGSKKNLTSTRSLEILDQGGRDCRLHWWDLSLEIRKCQTVGLARGVAALRQQSVTTVRRMAEWKWEWDKD